MPNDQNDYKIWPGNWKFPSEMARGEALRWWDRQATQRPRKESVTSDTHRDWRELNPAPPANGGEAR